MGGLTGYRPLPLVRPQSGGPRIGNPLPGGLGLAAMFRNFTAFVFGVVALAFGLFALIVFGPVFIGALTAEQVSGAYEEAGLDVSDCKKQFVKTTSCLKQPMREIGRRIERNDRTLDAWGDRDRRGRAEEPSLD